MSLKFQNPLEAISVASVLEEAVEKLKIIKKLYTSPQNEVSDAAVLTPLRSSVIQILRMTRDELGYSGTFRCLWEYVEKQEERFENDDNLAVSYRKTMQGIECIRRKIDEVSNTGKQVVQEKNKMIADILSEIQEELSFNETKINLTEKWEDAREQQNIYKCTMDETAIDMKVEDTARAIDGENRVDTEIENYLQLATLKLKEEVEKWRKRYDEEIAKREVELAALMEERNAELEKLERLNTEFVGRQKAIDDYLSAKEDLRRSEERHRYLNEMATKIQAWWRGTMVRRHLGPYKFFSKIVRPQKKGKGKKK